MKTLLLTLFITFFSLTSFSQTYLRVGTTISQIKIIGDELYVLGGVDPSRPNLYPSISVVNILEEKTKKIITLPEGMGLYRSLLHGTQLFVTTWENKELLKIDITKDLKSPSLNNPTIIYKDTTELTGMESVIKVGEQTWIAFSNLNDLYEFGNGHISILKNNKKIASITMETPNPKTMINIGQSDVALSLGTYSKNDGQVVIINTKKIPATKTKLFIKTTTEDYFYKIYNLPGTPGDLFYNEKNNNIYVCDLDFGAKRFFKINLNTQKITTVSGRFEDCGAIYVKNNKVYVAHFSAAASVLASGKHLYVYDDTTNKQVCSQSFLPGDLDTPSLLFTNDIEIYQKGKVQKLLVSFGVYPYIGILDINSKGIPEGCL